MDVHKYVKDLTIAERKNICDRYNNLETAIDIGSIYEISRESILALLKRSGVDISKRKIKVQCSACHKDIYRQKNRLRYSKHLFCDKHCYYAWLEIGNGKGKYKQSSWGQRVARKKVAALFDLKEGHVVHHENRDCLYNEVSNLKVFACQGDHVRHHRGFDVTPLWEG